MSQALLFDWSVSTVFGWGIYGLNLILHWPRVAGAPAYNAGPIDLASLAGMDPLRLRALAPALVASSQRATQRTPETPWYADFDGILVMSGGDRPRLDPPPGRPAGAVLVFADTMMPDVAETTRDLAVVIAQSSWGAEVLRTHGVANVAMIVQGIDPSMFHPGPRSNVMEDRFVVLSGGKLEHRKGQDLAILAFRAFAQRHREAILVTAWHSPWPELAASLDRNPTIAPVAFKSDGTLDPVTWAAANGLKEEQFLDLGRIPNHLIGCLLREVDVAIFPNRCEGATNFVAMECLACGIPTIVSDNTGHKDLVATGGTFPLTRQRPVFLDGVGTDGWGESDINEIVETLENVWSNREEARRRGEKGAAAMAQWSWRHHVERLHEALKPLCT